MLRLCEIGRENGWLGERRILNRRSWSVARWCHSITIWVRDGRKNLGDEKRHFRSHSKSICEMPTGLIIFSGYEGVPLGGRVVAIAEISQSSDL